MPYLPPVTVISETGGEWPSHRVSFRLTWTDDPGNDMQSLYGDLTLSTNQGMISETLASAQADAHVQDLLNRLSAALEGSAWTIDARKLLKSHQPITPDEV